MDTSAAGFTRKGGMTEADFDLTKTNKSKNVSFAAGAFKKPPRRGDLAQIS